MISESVVVPFLIVMIVIVLIRIAIEYYFNKYQKKIEEELGSVKYEVIIYLLFIYYLFIYLLENIKSWGHAEPNNHVIKLNG